MRIMIMRNRWISARRASVYSLKPPTLASGTGDTSYAHTGRAETAARAVTYPLDETQIE